MKSGNQIRRDALSAGTATRTTYTATSLPQWVGCGNGKTGTVTRFDKIHFDGAAALQELIFHYKLESAFLKNLVIILWLIQSQTQRGAASAALHQSHPHRRLDLVLAEIFGQIIDRSIRNFKHLFLHVCQNAPAELTASCRFWVSIALS